MDDAMEALGLDPDEVNEQLSEYANQLSGFMDVVPSLLLSLVELVCIFIVEMMQDIVRILSNIFLVMEGFDGYFGFNFNVVDKRFFAALDYCLGFIPGMDWTWITRAWRFLVKKVFKVAFDITVGMDAVQVNCTGAQLPYKLITNIMILMLIAFLIESKLYPLIRITSASVSKLYKGRLLVQLFVTAFVVGGEATFKLFIQIAAGTVDYNVQWYDHSCYGESRFGAGEGAVGWAS